MDKSSESKIFQKVDQVSQKLIEMSRAIWEHPEIGYQEYFACKTLTDCLKENSFETVVGPLGIPTAFTATAGDGKGPHIAFVAEYDALPKMDHACGHNLYCAAAVGAAIALLDATGGKNIKISVYGTPAEESTVPNNGAKVDFVRAGLFSDVDIAMMCHADGGTVIERTLAAVTTCHIEFEGKATDAKKAPQKGVNALDACLLAYNNINALRQHFYPGTAISPIIRDGGNSLAMIPNSYVMDCNVRSLSTEQRDYLLNKVIDCANAAALVTGCKVTCTPSLRPMDSVEPNHALGLSYRRALEAMNYAEDILQSDARTYGWDMGTVTHACPSLAPYMKIGPDDLVCHTDPFKQCANSPLGYQSVIDAAKALAYTAYDYLTDEDLRNAVKEEFHAKEHGKNES